MIIKLGFDQALKCSKMSSKAVILPLCVKRKWPKNCKDSKKLTKKTYVSKERCYSWIKNATTETILNNSYKRISCNRLRKAGCNLMSAKSAKIWRK